MIRLDIKHCTRCGTVNPIERSRCFKCGAAVVEHSYKEYEEDKIEKIVKEWKKCMEECTPEEIHSKDAAIFDRDRAMEKHMRKYPPNIKVE